MLCIAVLYGEVALADLKCAGALLPARPQNNSKSHPADGFVQLAKGERLKPTATMP